MPNSSITSFRHNTESARLFLSRVNRFRNYQKQLGYMKQKYRNTVFSTNKNVHDCKTDWYQNKSKAFICR